MIRSTLSVPERPRFFRNADLDRCPPLGRLPEDQRRALPAVAAVFPFHVTSYVLDHLIDWDAIPDDPIYQMTFPQAGMLSPADLSCLQDLIGRGAPQAEIEAVARRIRDRLNPHPAGQVELNVPFLGGRFLTGLQHKYRETVLCFPAQGQTCHAHCTYCFRWPQFVGSSGGRFGSHFPDDLVTYLRRQPAVTDVLFTGGDPLVMNARTLRRFIAPLLKDDLAHVRNIRLGTKVLGYWPFRFLTDPDADDLLRLISEVRTAGRSLAFMAHVSHVRELEPPPARQAIARLRDAGAVIRCQAPLIRHVNDSSRAWADLWREEVRLGLVPYYMFVARNTGPCRYFNVPLARAVDIFRRARNRVSGLARTARGPSMSAAPGKVIVRGTAKAAGRRVFVLEFEQARELDWVGRPFFAEYDPEACWLDELRPAFGEREFFFTEPMRRAREQARALCVKQGIGSAV